MKAALLSAGAAIVSLSTSMAMLPGAALATDELKRDAVYAGVYSPVTDIEGRSCEITSTGISSVNIGGNTEELSSNQGDGSINLNSITGAENTSLMRSIGQADGSAQSKAGIEFGLIGANIISIEDAEMYGLEDVTNTGDRDENVPMSGHVQLEVNEGSKVNYSGARYNQFLDDLNVIQPDGDSLIAKVDFSNGNTNMNGKKSGSIIVGSVVDADLAPKVSAAIEDLTGLTQQGEVRGVVTFNLKDAASTPEKYQAIVMKATITCQPVPEKR